MATVFGVNFERVSDSVSSALNYWGVAMRSILPQGLQELLTVGEEEIIVLLDEDTICVQTNVHGQITTLGTFPNSGNLINENMINLVKKQLTRDQSLLLVVPDAVVLSKSIDFPAAAADNMRQALLYEMDKYTPFPKQDVLFDTQIERRHAAKLQARLHILHRSQVSNVLEAFQQAKIRFDKLCSIDQKQINLLPETLRRKKAIIPHKRNWFLAFLLIALLMLGLAVPLYFKRDTAIKLEAQMASLSVQAQGESELWMKRDTKEQMVLDFIESYPISFSRVYEELSKIFPDDTWASSFIYHHGKITVNGEGRDVMLLIQKINANPLFKNARIASPIIKSRQDKNKEVYNITFESVTTTGVNP